MVKGGHMVKGSHQNKGSQMVKDDQMAWWPSNTVAHMCCLL